MLHMRYGANKSPRPSRYVATSAVVNLRCRWGLSDLQSLDKWADYTRAKEAMFFYTADAPWTVVKSNDKKRARLNCMQDFLVRLPYPGKNRRVVRPPDPLIVGPARHVLDFDRVAEAPSDGAS